MRVDLSAPRGSEAEEADSDRSDGRLGALPQILLDLVDVSFLPPFDVQTHERKVAAGQ